MPTTHKTVQVLVSEDERTRLKADADKAGLSISNLIRKKLGLPAIKLGAPMGNKFALKKKEPAASKKRSSKKRSSKAAK